jgi:hypothetical protein
MIPSYDVCDVLSVLSALTAHLQTTEAIAAKLNAKPNVVAGRLRALKYAGEVIMIDCGGVNISWRLPLPRTVPLQKI